MAEDINILKNTLEKIKFDVKLVNLEEEVQYEKKLKELARKDHSEMSCLMVFLLSYGDKSFTFDKSSTGTPYTVLNPFSSINCQTLIGKPKIFIVQDYEEKAMNMTDGSQRDSSPYVNSSRHMIFSENRDFMVAYYTMLDTHEKGSYFVQALSKIFNENYTEDDLVTMLTKVNQEVLEMGEGESKQVYLKRETLNSFIFDFLKVVENLSSLTRKLFLHRDEDDLQNGYDR